MVIGDMIQFEQKRIKDQKKALEEVLPVKYTILDPFPSFTYKSKTTALDGFLVSAKEPAFDLNL